MHAYTVRAANLDLTGLGLEYLPQEIGKLEHLEYLDLSHNQLKELPCEMACLKNLKKLFLTKNDFTEFPDVVGKLASLEMFSIKSNKIASIGCSQNIPSAVNWLILTDNRIQELPDDFGTHLPLIRKLAMSGNCLKELPASFGNLTQLELVRLSNNRIERIPDMLIALPRLAWVALGGNPVTNNLSDRNAALQQLEKLKLDFSDFTLGECIGSGASGNVYTASSVSCSGKQYALKMFKEISSDGLPEDELAVCSAVACAGDIPSGLIPVSGWFERPRIGLSMEYIEQASPLAGVPSLESITRDIYSAHAEYSLKTAVNILLHCAKALEYIHEKHVSHGDFYAHNILIQHNDTPRLGDWGASFFYPPEYALFEKIEVLSFGFLIEELNQRLENNPHPSLSALAGQCAQMNVSARPAFSEIVVTLEQIGSLYYN